MSNGYNAATPANIQEFNQIAQPFSYPQFSPLFLEAFPATSATVANGLNNSQEIIGGVVVRTG